MINLAVGGAIGCADVPALCDRVRAELVDGHSKVMVFDVGALEESDFGTVDALARACLTARRDGCELRLSEASVELRQLLELCGLAEALPCVEGLRSRG